MKPFPIILIINSRKKKHEKKILAFLAYITAFELGSLAGFSTGRSMLLMQISTSTILSKILYQSVLPLFFFCWYSICSILSLLSGSAMFYCLCNSLCITTFSYSTFSTDNSKQNILNLVSIWKRPRDLFVKYDSSF